MEENTRDLSKFGHRELTTARDLLNEYLKGFDGLSDGIAVEFNPNSGNVFLVDEDYNVAMMKGDKLELWYNCPYCGHEGFKEDMKHKPLAADCTEYLKQIGVIENGE